MKSMKNMKKGADETDLNNLFYFLKCKMRGELDCGLRHRAKRRTRICKNELNNA